jgi:hypothetical protein
LPSWEIEADTSLLKLQRLENKVLRITGNVLRYTPVRNLTTAFSFPYIYIRLYKQFYRQETKVIQNHENEHVRSIGQDEARQRKYKRHKFGGGQAYDRSSE